MQHSQHQKTGGFTLVEMIVSLGIFIIALFIATSSFLAIVNADRKARATRIAADNLNLSLEDMTRTIKTGYSYSCGGIGATADCAAAQSVFALTDQSANRIFYKRGTSSGVIVGGASASGCGAGYGATQGCILRSSDGGATFLPSTSPEIDITNLRFYTRGSAVWPDTQAPTVVISLDGSLGSQASTKVAFKIQSAITERVYDH